MGWLKNLAFFRNAFLDAKLPDDYPAQQLNQRHLVDLGYQLLYDESIGAFPTVKCNGKLFVLLSDIYRDPVPFLKVLKRRVNKGTAKVVFHNITDVIPSRFLLLPQKADKKGKGLCQYLDCEPNRPGPGWGVVNELLIADKRSPFSGPLVTNEDDDGDAVPRRTMHRWEITDGGNTVVFKRWRLPNGDDTAKQMSDFIRRSEAQGLLLPSHIEHLVEMQAKSYAVADTITYPRAAFMEELQLLAEQAIVFSHYLFGKFVEDIQGTYHFKNPQEGLSWRLYSWQMLQISRTELLAHVQKRFPRYSFHPLLNETVLTAPEMEVKIGRLNQTTARNAARVEADSLHSQAASLTPLVYEPAGRSPVRLQAESWNTDLVRYQQLFNMALRFVSLNAVKGKLEESDYSDAAIALVKHIPDLQGTWSGSPTAELVDPAIFWNRSVDFQYGGLHGERLAYALFCPVYGCGAPWLVDQCIEDVLQRLFSNPLRTEDWAVFKLDTEASSYFENDYWDYLWVAFHSDGRRVRVIYGTDTD